MSASPEDSTIGRVLGGRYRVVGRLGEGGMGSVYEAEHLSLGRRVALKVLHDHHAGSADLQARFEREARLLSQLRHPNVVTITDFGVDHGQPFLVMDLSRGRDLASLLQDGPLPPARALGIVRQILRGVAHAHRRGLVHRDLKPHNILVEVLEDGTDHVVVLDFGLARATNNDGTLTRSGLVVGTPAYMAPEQASGGTADARADVYALGNVLFELLAGRRPFPQREPHELLRAHLLTPPPSLKETCQHLEVPPALEALVERALSKEPRERFADASAMLEAIDATPVPTPREVTLDVRAALDPKQTMPARPRTPTPAVSNAPFAHATTERPPPMPGAAVPAREASRWRERGIALALLLTLAGSVAIYTALSDDAEPTNVASAPSTRAGTSSSARTSPAKTTMAATRAATMASATMASATMASTTMASATMASATMASPSETNEVATNTVTDTASDTPSDAMNAGGLWATMPEELAPIHAIVAEGRAVPRHLERRLAVLARRLPDDPRPAILLAHEYVRARSFTAALEPIEEAVTRDRRAVANDPWAVSDLVTLVASGATNRKALPLARRAKGPLMRAEVRARIATSNADDAARLRAFERSIR